MKARTARAPGRVNLIGDHTDYCGGLALPMAVDLATEVTFTPTSSPELLCLTDIDPAPSRFPFDIGANRRVLDDLEPRWGRLAAAVTALVRPPGGGVTRATSSVPGGAGMSSSAAYALALALALGAEGEPVVLARLCRRAEALTDADVGLMDPLVSAAAVPGHALLIDFGPDTPAWRAVTLPAPDALEVVVVHSGQRRLLARTPYAARRAECEAASLELGRPLGQAEPADLPGLVDPVLRRRTRHVVTECARVRAMADALAGGDLGGAGRLLVEGHRSLVDDFECSTPVVDQLVEDLRRRPGVVGARMTGGGFGGCVVALAEPGALDPGDWPAGAWRVTAAGGAAVAGGA